MTSAPSSSPTITPSLVPTSTIPTAPPSITGAVVFVDMETIVSEDLSNDEVAEIISAAETEFGLNPGDVNADISYDITGVIEITLDDSDHSEEDFISALQDSIANAINIHSSDIEIAFDPISGEAVYTISSASVEDATSLQLELLDPTTIEIILSNLSQEIPEVEGVTLRPTTDFDIQIIVIWFSYAF